MRECRRRLLREARKRKILRPIRSWPVPRLAGEKGDRFRHDLGKASERKVAYRGRSVSDEAPQSFWHLLVSVEGAVCHTEMS